MTSLRCEKKDMGALCDIRQEKAVSKKTESVLHEFGQFTFLGLSLSYQKMSTLTSTVV